MVAGYICLALCEHNGGQASVVMIKITHLLLQQLSLFIIYLYTVTFIHIVSPLKYIEIALVPSKTVLFKMYFNIRPQFLSSYTTFSFY